MTFGNILRAMYAIGIAFILIVVFVGLPYYALPTSIRPHSNLHNYLKPSGAWGHGLGITGSAMILLLLLYSARKRGTRGLGWGRLSRWLDVHIFLGVMGPLLITLHTSMKFGGIVSISYFSMLAVALSGVFGRYVYMQIPRDSKGHELSLETIRESIGNIHDEIADGIDKGAEALSLVRAAAASNIAPGTRGPGAVLYALWHDATAPLRAGKLRRALKHTTNRPSAAAIEEIILMTRRASLLERRIVVLDAMNHLLHYWHVLHKPFAYVMLIFMFAHIGISVAFGYRWVF